LGNKGPYRIVRKINDVNFVVKRTPKSGEEIIHIDRLTRYKNALPSQWKKEIEHEEREAIKVQTETDREVEPPVEEDGGNPLGFLKGPRAETRECPAEAEERFDRPTDVEDPCDEQLFMDE